MTTYSEALRQASGELVMHTSAGLDAEVLLAHVLDKPRSHLHAWPERTLSAADERRFTTLIARRRAGEPVAHLTGRREFWSLLLEVNADTLIPRPDTEILVEQALERLPEKASLRVADLGTGSGAIALALAKERPHWQVYALDASAACVEVARRNAGRLGVRVSAYLRADWTRCFTAGALDAIVSNPPYVADNDAHLQQGDVRYEPRSALAAGADGLDAIRAIAADAGRVLVRGGRLFLEHAPGQSAEIHSILNNHNFIDIHTVRDLAGLERVTCAISAGRTVLA